MTQDLGGRPWPAELAHLSWLIGAWGGIGEGQYPTVAPFRYEQNAEFACDGRDFLEYRAISWIVDEQDNRLRPSDTETGYLRAQPNNGVEMLLAHPTGFVELWVGRVEVSSMVDGRITGAKMELTTDAVVRSQSAIDVSAGHRLYGLVGGRLLATYDMVAMGHPLANHTAIAMEPLNGPG